MEEERKPARKRWVKWASLAGVAALATGGIGGSMATWKDSTELSGGVISAGNISVAGVGDWTATYRECGWGSEYDDGPAYNVNLSTYFLSGNLTERYDSKTTFNLVHEVSSELAGDNMEGQYEFSASLGDSSLLTLEDAHLVFDNGDGELDESDASIEAGEKRTVNVGDATMKKWIVLDVTLNTYPVNIHGEGVTPSDYADQTVTATVDLNQVRN